MLTNMMTSQLKTGSRPLRLVELSCVGSSVQFAPGSDATQYDRRVPFASQCELGIS